MKVSIPLLAFASLATSVSAAPVLALARGLLDSVTGPMNTTGSMVASDISSVLALLSGDCDSAWKCALTVSGPIENMLVDGSDFKANQSVSGWCSEGHCYGASQTDLAVPMPIPFEITCGNSSACTGTLYGSVDAVFANGPQIELWGWVTPSGYCKNGVCYASITALGDPAYKS